MSVIYILSDQSNPGRYKVGSHRGTLKKLRSRYITALPSLQIHYFIQTPYAKTVEDSFKRLYSQYRVENSNGNLSEWVNMVLENVIVAISMLLMQCQARIENGVTMIDLAAQDQYEFKCLQQEAQRYREENALLRQEIQTLQQEVARQKIESLKPNQSETLVQHPIITDQREQCALQFVLTRLCKILGARVAVADVNDALDRFSKPANVKYNYHDHSKYLKRAGLTEPESRTGTKYYIDWELRLETQTAYIR